LARWGQPPPPGCAPSWSPVKINPVLAKPRTTDQFASIKKNILNHFGIIKKFWFFSCLISIPHAANYRSTYCYVIYNTDSIS